MHAAVKEYFVGPYKIILPAEHMLDQYQARWKKYDIALGDIARIVYRKYPELAVIDIGANVGDSAALICKHQSIPVLCIEGNTEFLPFLEENASRISNLLIIEKSYIGHQGNFVNKSGIQSDRGTSTIVGAISHEDETDSVKMKSLRTILQSNSSFSKAKLLKIDTDGFDFQILSNSIDVISDIYPVIFFEYFISYSTAGPKEGIAAIKDLVGIGYKRYLVYDNFGNFLCSVTGSGIEERFLELNSYLLSHRRFGKGIGYFDVCAFADEDADLFNKTRLHELLE